ncbi:hypothetical protein E1A91_D12G299200v1 [Gossypium mustelinum]|uniref:Uncharacterized protein n=1 Tax=Gossypium mustelinum TaxID=34275 RepID=A0A5D2SJR7_GOSMU|nr:hypothetical protein E1A91_D12G299200v1 [Gossypium mustelinum]
MGFQSKSSLQAENTVDDDDVMEDFNGEDSESGESLIDKLKYISWPENVDWMHKLPLDTDQEKKVDVNDDSARQLVPKRGKNKEAKRIAKEVQAEKLKERAKQKKQEIEAVKKEFWNSKFGFRGRIGFKKQNTAETTNDLKGFNNGSIAGNKKRKR